MKRSHKSKHINGGTGHSVRRPKLSEQGKQRLEKSSKLKPSGYGALEELERVLAAIKPRII